MQITIKHHFTDTVLYTHDATNKRIADGLAMRDALEAACKVGANMIGADLSGANLIDANLRGADLRCVNLRGADLRCVNLRGADLSGANMISADLSGANLIDANLRGSNLIGVNLRGVYLIGAKWVDGVPVTRSPLQINGLHWPVTILDQHMQIGCQAHCLHDWSAFDDSQIAAMDGRNALRFWRANKDALLFLARADGRNFAPVAQAQEVA